MAVMRRGGNTAERSENQGNTEQIGFSQEKGPGFMFLSAKTTLNQCFLNTGKPPLEKEGASATRLSSWRG